MKLSMKIGLFQDITYLMHFKLKKWRLEVSFSFIRLGTKYNSSQRIGRFRDSTRRIQLLKSITT